MRFGEFLRDRQLISEEQWLAALADHWSSSTRLSIGATIVAHGFLTSDVVEAEARAFHDDLDVIEVFDDPNPPRHEKVTLRLPHSAGTTAAESPTY